MRHTCSPHFEASKKSWWVQNFKRHWEHMFIWSNSFSGTLKIISKHIPSLVKIYSLRKIPRSNDEHKWKYQHHEQDTCSHGQANEGYKHSTIKAWRNTWPTSRGCFWQAKRKNVVSKHTPEKRREFDVVHMSLSEALEILSKKGYLKPLEPTILPILFPSTCKMNE